MNLLAKSVLITGANRGIGLELVKQLLVAPHPPKHVFATCRNPSEAHELIEYATKHSTLHVIPIKDIRDYTGYESLVQKVESVTGEDGLNLLINNAGISLRNQTLDSVDQEQMLETFEINSVSPLLLTKAFLPLLEKAAKAFSSSPMSCSRAAVVNISTQMASIEDNKIGGFYSYRASKAALNIITKSLSIDLKDDNIVVVAIHPGWVQTDMGGPRATMTKEDSGRYILNTLASINKTHSGQFLNYDGRILPW